jgi:O-antigen/teichoic acid export membrane protein
MASYRSDVWPLLARRIVTAVMMLLLLTILGRPTFGPFSVTELRRILRFGGGVLGFNMLNACNRNADNMLIGRYFGSAALGNYSVAYSILLTPVRQINAIVQTTVFPRLVLLMPDGGRVGQALGNTMGALAQLCTPPLTALCLVSGQLVRLFLGDRWVNTEHLFQVFAALAIYQIPFAQSGIAFMVARRTSLMFTWAAVSTPVIVASFFFGLHWGVVGVAIAYTLASIALSPLLIRFCATALSAPPRVIVASAFAGYRASLPWCGLILSVWLGVGLLHAAPINQIMAACIAASLSVVWNYQRLIYGRRGD